MDQKIAGIVGAVAGLTCVDVAQAAVVAPNPQGFADAKSYAELLEPIPNALALLQSADAARAVGTEHDADVGANVQLARWYHHHHHHHHHRFFRHHHHHHRYWRRYHHHHHHHHHHHY